MCYITWTWWEMMESVFHNKHLNTFSHHIVMKCIACDKLPYYAGIVLVVELQKWELTNWYFLGFRQLNCWSKSEIEHVRRINRLCLLCFLCCRQNITYSFHFMLQNTFSTILPSPKESSSFFHYLLNYLCHFSCEQSSKTVTAFLSENVHHYPHI